MFRPITQAEYATALEYLREVRELIATRDRRAKQGELRDIDLPSIFWKIIKNFNYVLNPSYDVVNTWRFHTFPFTGFYIGNALPAYWRPAPENIVNEYRKLTVQLPYDLIARPPRILGEIGWEINGGLVNEDILSSVQKHIRALYLSGVVGHLKGREHIRILEIGPGYGGLAYFLWKMLKPQNYCLIDIPESLAFSSVYLGLASGNGITIYNGNSMHGEGLICVPNFLADDLRDRCKFDLIINTGSFGEMTLRQVKHYDDLMNNVLADGGIIYEENGESPEFTVRDVLTGKLESLTINKNNRNMRLWVKDREVLSSMRTFGDYRPSPWRNTREWLPWRLSRIKRKWQP